MAKNVFEKKEASDLAVAYVPRKFPAVVSKVAKAFVALQGEGGSASRFQIDRIVSQQTGIADMERISIEEKIEREALERLKDIQEKAYKEAYELGLDEGRTRALQSTSAEVAERVERLDAVLQSVENLKSELAQSHEAHLVKLVFHIAHRIAMAESRTRPETVSDILERVVEDAKSDERIVVRVSPDDKRFVEEARARKGAATDSEARVRIEESDRITPGGCIIETNYGSIDATIEQRAKKVWEALSGSLPRTTDTTASE